MAVFGPRLDRPSGVGVEGRPRATSLTIASVVTVGLFVLAGWVLEAPGLLLQFGTIIGFTTAGAALQTRTRFGERLMGHLFFLPAATAAVLLILGQSSQPVGLVLTGFVVAMIALGTTWANVADVEGWRETTTGTGLTYVSLFLWIVVFAVVGVTYASILAVVTDSAVVGAPLLSFVAFFAILAGTALAVRFALSSLPVLQLTPRDERDRIRARLARYRQLSTRLAVVAGVLAMVALVVAGYATGGRGVVGDDPVGAVSLVFGSPFVLGPLVVVGTVALLAAVLAKALRLVTTHLDASTGRIIAALGAAGIFFALFLLVVALVPDLVAASLLAVALLLPLGLLILLAGLLVLVEFDVVPDRAGGPAIAAAGLFTAALGAGLANFPPAVVFAIVAGALVVWDVSTFGLGVTAELGHLPETRRLELFHGVLAVGVGAIAVGGLWAVVFGRRTLQIVGSGPVAAVVLVVGVVLLAAALRG